MCDLRWNVNNLGAKRMLNFQTASSSRIFAYFFCGTKKLWHYSLFHDVVAAKYPSNGEDESKRNGTTNKRYRSMQIPWIWQFSRQPNKYLLFSITFTRTPDHFVGCLSNEHIYFYFSWNALSKHIFLWIHTPVQTNLNQMEL